MIDFIDFKKKFYEVRDNRKTIRSILNSLMTLENDVLGALYTGATNYSSDRIQANREPDAAVIDALNTLQNDYNEKVRKLKSIKETDSEVERMIYETPGTTGEILTRYFMDGEQMKNIAKALNYSESHCWKLLRRALENLHKEVCKNE